MRLEAQCGARVLIAEVPTRSVKRRASQLEHRDRRRKVGMQRSWRMEKKKKCPCWQRLLWMPGGFLAVADTAQVLALGRQLFAQQRRGARAAARLVGALAVGAG
ncbi:hypothetical protein L1887_47897 [Cichorium endivia]|nr:hypothetical protein L1887_47897 [Cichorium endivia]